MRKFILILIFYLSLGVCFAANIYRTQTDNAEKSFKNGDFQKTVAIYESLIQIEKIRDPYIYYNLSNAYYKSGSIGKAVLNIEKALRFAPRDRDIRRRFRFLHAAAGESIKYSISDIFLGYFSFNEITVLASAVMILFLFFFSLFLLKKNIYFKRAVILFSVFLIICLPFFILKGFSSMYVQKAVMLNSSVLRNNPDKNGNEVFQITEGKVVNIISENGQWAYIKFQSEGTDVSGWTEFENMEKINE
ncbi:MAG: hypothetical protein LBL71_02190 [Endomicrobium sp.]|nr:hypothetical protein [Endomicrobium sp.]